jgi:hypothetical protein
VPFLLRLPGQKAGVTYAPPFDTIVTRSLIMAILRGQLTEPGDIAARLGRE